MRPGTPEEAAALLRDAETAVIPRGGDVEAAPIEFEAAVLRDAIGKTVFCAFIGEARPVLTGVLV